MAGVARISAARRINAPTGLWCGLLPEVSPDVMAPVGDSFVGDPPQKPMP